MTVVSLKRHMKYACWRTNHFPTHAAVMLKTCVCIHRVMLRLGLPTVRLALRPLANDIHRSARNGFVL